MKVFRDNVHGDIELSPSEMRLVHHPDFQRLHGCRQLGITHLIYPCAKHSRFEHVIGVMHVATQIAEWLKKQDEYFTDSGELRTLLRLSALLHDMGHVPFGHTLEDEMPLISKHDTPASSSTPSRMDTVVTRILTDSGHAEHVSAVLQILRAIDLSKDDDDLYTAVDNEQIRPDFLVLADIIGNTICADLLDYIRRDHLMTGIQAGYDNRIFRYFGVDTHTVERPATSKSGSKVQRNYKRVVIRLVKNGRVRNDALADLLDILKLRYNLSDKVLFHPKKCAADAMLIRAVADLKLTAEDLMQYSDDGFLDAHRKHPIIESIRQRKLFKPVFSSGWDEIQTFDKQSKEELITAVHKSLDLRTRVETAVEAKVGLPPQSVLIFCPRPKMTLKPVRVLVQWRDGTVHRLSEIEERDDLITHKQVALLQDIYPRLWRMYLFVRPEFRSKGQKIQRAFTDALRTEANISATCDPAFQYYLETCDDYALGRLIDEEIASNAEFTALPRERKVELIDLCHAELQDETNNDAYRDAVLVLEHRSDGKDGARKIIDSVWQKMQKSKKKDSGASPLFSKDVGDAK